MIFLKQKLNKEIKSLLNQPRSFNLPTYCPLREPHHTLDFLAEHRLFPALQHVVSQAVDKLSHACRHNGFPLFPVTSETTPVLPGNSDLLQPSSKASISNREARGEPCDSPTAASSPKTSHRKSKGRRGSPPNEVQMATRFRLKATPTQVSNVPIPSFHSMQEAPNCEPQLQKQTMALNYNHISRPCHGLHLTLPAPGIRVEVASCQGRLRGPVQHRLASPCCLHSHFPFPMVPPFLSLGKGFSTSPPTLHPEVTSRAGLEALEEPLKGRGSFTDHF